MKIALVIHAFDAKMGGAEHWTCQYARLLAAQGHQLHVIARDFGPEADELGVVRHPLPATKNRLQLATAAAEIAETLPDHVIHDMGLGWQCDLFQPHGGARKASYEQNLAMMSPWLRPLKRAISPWLPRYRDFAQLEEQQYRPGGPLLVALSKMVAGHFQQHYSVPREQIRLVYNGVDVKRFSPALRFTHRDTVRNDLQIASDETLLLIVAHNFTLKGVPAAIRAVSRLTHAGRKVRLAVVGGRSTAAGEKLAAAAQVSQQVTFLGPIADPRPYYAAADIYVQPTFYDPCSLVVLEALACGLPVITSRFNGAGELITPGVEGDILDNPHDDQMLADQIDGLLDPNHRQAMGQAARHLAEQHSLDRNLNEMLNLYEECLDRKGKVRRAA